MNSLQPTNCLSVFDHFRRLALKGLRNEQINPFKPSVAFRVKNSHLICNAKKDLSGILFYLRKQKNQKNQKKLFKKKKYPWGYILYFFVLL